MTTIFLPVSCLSCQIKQLNTSVLTDEHNFHYWKKVCSKRIVLWIDHLFKWKFRPKCRRKMLLLISTLTSRLLVKDLTRTKKMHYLILINIQAVRSDRRKAFCLHLYSPGTATGYYNILLSYTSNVIFYFGQLLSSVAIWLIGNIWFSWSLFNW